MNYKCWLGKHEHVIIKQLTEISSQVGCKNCSKKWAYIADIRSLVPWNIEMDLFYKYHVEKEV